jgi:hypothetical protein
MDTKLWTIDSCVLRVLQREKGGMCSRRCEAPKNWIARHDDDDSCEHRTKDDVAGNIWSGSIWSEFIWSEFDASTRSNGNAPPRNERGIANVHAFRSKSSHSSTVDDPESESRYQGRNVSEAPQPSPLVVDPHYSQPGAFPVDGSYDMTQTTVGISVGADAEEELV